MTDEATVDSPQNTNGRVYLDAVVSNTRAASSPKRHSGLAWLMLPLVVAGAAFVILRRARTALD
jgi:hypothetical protein